jgi:hypothetical protein
MSSHIKKGGTVMKTDTELRNDVQDKRKWTPVNAVMLPGYVESWPDKKSEERVAKRVSGIKALAEETEISAFEMIKTKDGVVHVIENGKKCLGGSFLRESQALAFINDRIKRQQRVESLIEHDCFREGGCGFSCDGCCERCGGV